MSEERAELENTHAEPQKSVIRCFPFSFWLVCLLCVLLYGTVVPFNNIASDFLMSKWYPNDTETAGIVMSIPDTISAFLVPFCGFMVDKHGYRVSSLFICSLVIAGVHLTLGLSSLTPVVPLLFLGISYSIYGAAIWPSIATIIQHHEDKTNPGRVDSESKLLGTAYGVATSALNTALTLMPIAAAQIRVNSGDYLYVELFFTSLALVGSVFCIVLWIFDRREGSILQKSDWIASEELLENGHESDEDDLVVCPGAYIRTDLETHLQSISEESVKKNVLDHSRQYSEPDLIE